MTNTITEMVGIILAIIIGLDAITGFKLTRSIFNRGKLKINDLAEAARDPIADASAALEKIKGEREGMLKLRTDLLIETKAAKARQVKATSDVAKYEQLALKAGTAKNADDVKLALSKKQEAQKALDLAILDEQRLTKQEDSVENKIQEFDALISQAENNKNFLASSLKINEFDKKVNTVLKDNNGEALSAIAKLEQDVQRSAIEAEVAGELAAETKGLEDKYTTPQISDSDIAHYMK